MSESSIQISTEALSCLIKDYTEDNEKRWQDELAERKEFWLEKEAKYNKSIWPKLRNFLGMAPKKFNYARREYSVEHDYEQGVYKYRTHQAKKYTLLASHSQGTICLKLTDLEALTNHRKK